MPDTDLTFNTTAGQTVGREMLIAYLNTGESGTPLGPHREAGRGQLY